MIFRSSLVTSTACFKSSRPQKFPNVCHTESLSIRDIDPATMSAISPEKEKNPEVTAEAEKKAEETKGEAAIDIACRLAKF